MKDFIQNRLRVLLEVVTNRDSDLDIPSILKFGGPSHGYDSETMYFMIAKASELAKKIPAEVLSTSYGNGGYEFMLTQTRSGNFIFRGKPTTKHFQPGEYNIDSRMAGKILYLYTMGCSKYPEGETQPCKTIYNPMVDAKIKILTDPVLKQAIMDFINDGLGYLDDKGEEIRQAKMTPDEIAKLAGKEGRYDQKAAIEKGYFGDEVELRNELSKLVGQRRELNKNDFENDLEYKTKLKSIKDAEEYLKKELAKIEKERGNRFSKNL